MLLCDNGCGGQCTILFRNTAKKAHLRSTPSIKHSWIMTPAWKFRLSVHSLFRFEILNCTIHVMVFTFLDVYVCNVFDGVSSQMLKKSENVILKYLDWICSFVDTVISHVNFWLLAHLHRVFTAGSSACLIRQMFYDSCLFWWDLHRLLGLNWLNMEIIINPFFQK